jgi:hypothetical protein
VRKMKTRETIKYPAKKSHSVPHLHGFRTLSAAGFQRCIPCPRFPSPCSAPCSGHAHTRSPPHTTRALFSLCKLGGILACQSAITSQTRTAHAPTGTCPIAHSLTPTGSSQSQVTRGV